MKFFYVTIPQLVLMLMLSKGTFLHWLFQLQLCSKYHNKLLQHDLVGSMTPVCMVGMCFFNKSLHDLNQGHTLNLQRHPLCYTIPLYLRRKLECQHLFLKHFLTCNLLTCTLHFDWFDQANIFQWPISKWLHVYKQCF